MSRPPKISTGVPTILQNASPEARALGIGKHNLNVVVAEIEYRQLEELAAMQSDAEVGKLTVSDIVRSLIGQVLVESDSKFGGIVSELAVSSLEHQAAIEALRNKLK